MSNPAFDVTFSTFIASLSASALSCLGEHLIDNEKKEVDLAMAQFNINLIRMLKEKTINNLSKEEDQFINEAINDLQIKFIKANKS